MRASYIKFKDNMVRVKELGALYEALCRLMTAAVDPSDILRAQLVLGVSALDAFVHDVVKVGAVEMSNGLRPRTERFDGFKMPLTIVEQHAAGTTLDICVATEVSRLNGFLAFQDPDKINGAIAFFAPDIKLWDYVGLCIQSTAEIAKNRLGLIVSRRNKIAHEADADPSYPGQRWPINSADVADSLSYIETVGEAIYSLVKL